jgi:predicted DsbA family dithiol-disulfide isomerase
VTIPRLDIWSDFTCPRCFLSALNAQKLAQERELELHWRSFQVWQPHTAPSLDAAARAAAEQEREYVARIVLQDHGVTLHPARMEMNTRLPHILLRYAESVGKGNSFYNAVSRAYWVEGRAIDLPEHLEVLASQAGLDGNAAMFALTNLKFTQAMDADRHEAEARGLTSIPTLLVDGQHAISAADSYQAFRRAIDPIIAPNNASSTTA